MTKKSHPTPRQRLFTDEYKLGDHVCVIRAEHGWHDGGVEGYIVSLSANSCTVFDDETGYEYFINHPRDIIKHHSQLGPASRQKIIATYKARES